MIDFEGNLAPAVLIECVRALLRHGDCPQAAEANELLVRAEGDLAKGWTAAALDAIQRADRLVRGAQP